VAVFLRHDCLFWVYREVVLCIVLHHRRLGFLLGMGVRRVGKVLELDFLLYLYDDSMTYIPRGFRGMDRLFFGIEYQLEHPVEIDNRTCNTSCALCAFMIPECQEPSS
jgi:NAD-dependent dihydropyrimidine dehydrogenase PreA subunit